jgi:hypothetical protein
MVLLNIDITINRNSMINSIKKIMQNVMEQYMENKSYVKDENKLIDSIIKTEVEKIKDKHFWYINASENVCTYVHKKRGKKEGHMCHKRINTNLEGAKKDYLCCTHKRHVLRKEI